MSEFVLPPSLIPNLIDWTLVDYSGIQQSPLSGAIRTVSRGQRWQAHVQYHDLVNDDRALLSALMASIRGKSNRVWLEDPGYVQRGSFPATEMLANNYFVNGTTGWSVNGGASMAAYNRALAFTASNTGSAGLYQPVAVVNGVAYAMRACIIDGNLSVPITCGVAVADAGTATPNVGLARGLITATRTAAAGGLGNQFAIDITAGAVAGSILLCTYASLRRCALVVNPGAVTYYTTLPVTALPISTNGLLRAGDKFEVNAELKTVTFDLNSDASGAGTLMFEPALRKVVPNNAPVIIGEPMMRGILVNNAMQVTRPGLLSDFDFTFTEA